MNSRSHVTAKNTQDNHEQTSNFLRRKETPLMHPILKQKSSSQKSHKTHKVRFNINSISSSESSENEQEVSHNYNLRKRKVTKYTR